MDQLDIAVQNTALKSEDSAKKLASNMGLRYQTLINKCNPSDDTHKLGLREAIAMMQLSGDRQILEVMADDLGFHLERKELSTELDMVSALLATGEEHGDVSRAIQEAISDGKITPRELDNIRRQVSEAKGALDKLFGTVIKTTKNNA